MKIEESFFITDGEEPFAREVGLERGDVAPAGLERERSRDDGAGGRNRVRRHRCDKEGERRGRKCERNRARCHYRNGITAYFPSGAMYLNV